MLEFAINEMKEAASTKSCEATLYVDLDTAIEILKASHSLSKVKPWTECSWVGSKIVSYKKCEHLEGDLSCALKIKLECDTVCDFVDYRNLKKEMV